MDARWSVEGEFVTISKREERAAMLHERFWARVEKASETPEKSASAARAHLEQCPNRPTAAKSSS